MPGTWPTSAISRSSRPSICPGINPSSMPSFTSSRPLPPTRSTRSSPSATFSSAIVSKPQPENPLSGLHRYDLRRDREGRGNPAQGVPAQVAPEVPRRGGQPGGGRRPPVRLPPPAPEPVEVGADHQRHRAPARGVQAPDQDPDRAAL